MVKYPGIYRWKFKIRRLPKGGWWTLILGVWKTKNKPYPVTNDCFTFTGGGPNEYGYAFNAAHGHRLTANGCNSAGGEYGRTCKKGDIVEIVLDLYEFTFGVRINDKDYGVMYQVENTEYRVAFCNDVKWVCIEML